MKSVKFSIIRRSIRGCSSGFRNSAYIYSPRSRQPEAHIQYILGDVLRCVDMGMNGTADKSTSRATQSAVKIGDLIGLSQHRQHHRVCLFPYEGIGV